MEELGIRVNPKSLFKITLGRKNYFIYRLNLNGEKLKLGEGQEIGRLTFSKIILKRNMVPSVKVFFFMYPLISLFFKKL